MWAVDAGGRSKSMGLRDVSRARRPGGDLEGVIGGNAHACASVWPRVDFGNVHACTLINGSYV